MNYAELVEYVVQTTGREELIPQIQIAIAKATLKFHAADFWLQDRVEVKITPQQTLGQRLEVYVSSQLPGFRKMSYLNGYDDITDPLNPTVMQEFVENDPNSIRDSYGVRKWDVYYLAGDILTCWAGTVPPKLLAGYYKYPEVQASNFKSWIARDLGYVIGDEASKDIFGPIGDADEAARRKNMFQENLAIVRMNSVKIAAD